MPITDDQLPAPPLASSPVSLFDNFAVRRTIAAVSQLAVDQAFQLAYSHQAGRLDQAAALYRNVLHFTRE